MRLIKPHKPKGEMTKRKILEAFKACINKTGYTQIRTQDIAREANLTSSNVYYYFESKEKILEEALKREAKKLYRNLSQISKRENNNKTDELAEFFFDDSTKGVESANFFFEIIDPCMKNDRINSLRHEIDEACKSIIEEILIKHTKSTVNSRRLATFVYEYMIGTRLIAALSSEKNLEQQKNIYKETINSSLGHQKPNSKKSRNG